MSKKRIVYASISNVIQKAIQDFTFMNALIKNVDGALKDWSLSLSKRDIKTLKEMLGYSSRVNGEEILKIISFYNTGSKGKDFPIPPWGGTRKPDY